MAAASEPAGHVTRKQIVRLAAAISADNMAAIAEGYMDIDDATIKNLQYENKAQAQAFNREILRYWTNKNSGQTQIQVRKLKHKKTPVADTGFLGGGRSTNSKCEGSNLLFGFFSRNLRENERN